jgi:RPA family protein
MNQRVATFLGLALLGGTSYAPAIEAADPEFTLRLKDHRFAPSELTIPAGRKVRLIVENQDATAEEFESYELNREKVVPGNGRIVVFVGPLKPGRYEFFGEFNAATARGALIAR